jgi:cobalt transporter subunit CbtA
MLHKLVTGAVIAGFSAGLLAAVLHLLAVQPLLLLAETFELGDHAHGAVGAHGMGDDDGHAYSIDWTRNALTLLFFALTYAGFALVLAAVMSVRQALPTLRQGILWGLAGFAAVQLAPAFGQPLVPPGLEAAALSPRQIWWFATVALTAAGLWTLAFGRGAWAWGGLGLITVPHLGLAPAAVMTATEVPGTLIALFTARTLAVGAIAWATLGGLTAVLLRR